MPFAVDHADLERQVFQPSDERAGEVCAGRSVRSGDGDVLVPLVPCGRRVLVKPTAIEFAVVLEGGDGLLRVTMCPAHQARRRIPLVVQNENRNIGR